MLEKILATTHERVKEIKSKYQVGYFKESSLFHSPTISLKEYVLREDKNGIIAEFKRCSPSKGDLNLYASVQETTIGYMRAGCSALSILTEPHFFKGSNTYLTEARFHNFCPVLRKDFIVDPIQLYEARAIGADAVLFIARILDNKQMEELTQCAAELGLEVLLEIDDEYGTEKILPQHTMVGVNSRNLGDMSVDFKRLTELKKYVPTSSVLVAESGINRVEQIQQLRADGYKGFLMGSVFMQTANPALACQAFCRELSKAETLNTIGHEA